MSSEKENLDIMRSMAPAQPNHTPSLVMNRVDVAGKSVSGSGMVWQASCSCGWQGPITTDQREAAEVMDKHTIAVKNTADDVDSVVADLIEMQKELGDV